MAVFLLVVDSYEEVVVRVVLVQLYLRCTAVGTAVLEYLVQLYSSTKFSTAVVY